VTLDTADAVKLYKQKLSSADPHLLIIGEVMLFPLFLFYAELFSKYFPLFWNVK